MAGRPSLSRPSYGALTGTINWSRGMDEGLAQAPLVAPFQAQPTPVAVAPAPAPAKAGSNAFTPGAGNYNYIRNRYFRT